MTTYTFAVYPTRVGFDPFLLDVPSDDIDKAARRAYFTAMSHLAPRGFDVEDFRICVWENESDGRPVTPKGVS